MKKNIMITGLALWLAAVGFLPGISRSFAEDNYVGFEELPNVKEADESCPYFIDTQLYRKFNFPAELPEVPRELMVYTKVPEEELTYEKMKSIGDLFDMGEGCTVHSRGPGWLVYAKKNCCEIEFQNSSKVFSFYDHSVQPADGISLPNEETGKSIAESYLKEKGLWLENLEFKGISYRIRGTTTESGMVITKKVRMNIRYEFYDIGDNPAISRVTVTIIPGPKIKEVVYYLLQYQPYKFVKAISPPEAIDRTYQGDAFFRIKEGGFPPEVTVSKFRLRYEVAGGEINPEVTYLQPIYYFEGETENGVPFSIKVAAADSYHLKKKEVFAAVDVDPETINLKGKGKWITSYIELPEGYDVSDVDLASIFLWIPHTVEKEYVPREQFPVEIGDYDKDGIPDLMVKFDRQEVHEVLRLGDRVPIFILGKVKEKPFRGIDYVRVIE